MPELSEEDRRILEHLRERVGGGEAYVRAKHIAEHIGLSAKQVGTRLPKVAEAADEVDIEKWGRSRSTTWRVTPD
jgi:DNA-binding Lrp family transcriptional regulator